MVLSMSKRIMNEVMNIATDNNIKIYYQDTDSMHIERSKVSLLESKYYEKYNKVLKGENLGNFHGDFAMKDDNGKKINGNIYAIRSIFLGKKSYIDHLKAEWTDKDGLKHTKYDYHIRLKGITAEGIKHQITQHEDAFDMFIKLAQGDEMEFILNPSVNKPSFEYTPAGVHTLMTGEFKRILHYGENN